MTRVILPGLVPGILVIFLAAISGAPRPPLRMGGDPLVFANVRQHMQPSVAQLVGPGSVSAGFLPLRYVVLEVLMLTRDVTQGGEAVIARPSLSMPSELKSEKGLLSSRLEWATVLMSDIAMGDAT